MSTNMGILKEEQFREQNDVVISLQQLCGATEP
jgi:hypothetical protein